MEGRAGLAVDLVGSFAQEGGKGSAVRQGSEEGREARDVAGESAEESEDEVEAEEWACNRDKMLLLLALEGTEWAVDRVEEAELLADWPDWLDLAPEAVGKDEEGELEADEVEDRKRNMMWVGAAQSSCDAGIQ